MMKNHSQFEDRSTSVSESHGHPSRRAFLKASGFALFVSALEGCGRAPVQYAKSLLDQPEGAAPGKSDFFYASICGGCTAACGILVKNRDGRPIKLEGNPDHPLSRGGLCAVGQASVLSLYDSHRLKQPLAGGNEADWNRVDAEITARLAEIRQRGGAVRFLTESLVSPTRKAAVERFLSGFEGGRLVSYDPLSCSAVLDAHQKTHGERILPRYRFDRAEVIVGFDADFLGTWISPVEYTVAYRDGRVPSDQSAAMSYHVQFESRVSLTGANADRRQALPPDQIGAVLSRLARRIAERAGVSVGHPTPPDSPGDATELDDLAERLWHARGKSLVVCGSQDVDAQVTCNHLNALLDNYGSTLDILQPSRQRQGNDAQLTAFLQELAEGKVDALFVAAVNPVYDLPGGERLRDSLKRVPLLVSFSTHADETAELADYVCPEGHWLEQWTDAEPVAGKVSVGQPAIRPLGNTRSLLTSLAAWSGKTRSDYESVQEFWKEHVYPRKNHDGPFQAFWDKSVHDGFAAVQPNAVPAIAPPAITLLPSKVAAFQPDRFTLVLYPKIALLDGRHAHNPWLQELPDPISKVTWDNYVSVGPETARRLGIRDGDLLRLESSDGVPAPLELPALVQPGQHEACVAVALGYGRKGTDRFAGIGPQWIEARWTTGTNNLVGTNAAPWLRLESGELHYERPGVTVTKTGRKNLLARTQQYQKITVPEDLQLPGGERRPNVEETTLGAYHEDPTSGRHVHHTYEDLWPNDHPYTGHHWGLVVDLNKCTGCSACVIACQAENNVPVVGKDEVRRNREMHWIRIDRYYSEARESVDVLFQPMMCHHCDNAPCETVCPVLATAHSDEGLNQQVYNRCVGTRYCANNCPYKVRRFNWFNYAHPDEQENLVLNPDVTVRTRGVMEKCSFCVQRIQEAKLEAKRLGMPLADGQIRPACQQSCPAGAIVFGDLNDAESEVSKASASPRCYQVLSELNVRPTVGYLRIVRNREDGERTAHHV